MAKFLRRLRQRHPATDPALARTVLGAMREDRGRFASLRNARILFYWPHGLGDWVHLSAIAPLLEQSNVYAITRFGDDYVAAMDGNGIFTPLYSGVRVPGDGSERGARHFGIALERCNGGKVTLVLPAPLDDAIGAFAPEALLWTDYPETEGRSAYPFHTKARNLARLLVTPERLQSFDLSQPLPSTVDFSVPEQTQRAIDSRLSSFAPSGSRLGIVSRGGITAARKNWGTAGHVLTMVRALRARDPRWRFVSMDGDEEMGLIASYRRLFGDLDEPFVRAFKALLARTGLLIGVPAGPLHVAMSRGGIPIVGLWLAHHPDWYDEPNPLAMHVIGRGVRDRGFERRPATLTKPLSLHHRLRYLDDAQIPVADVMSAIDEVLSLTS